MREEKITM